MMNPIQLYDTVALLQDMPEENLVCGQVGVVIEELAPCVYEVEFSDAEGRTYALLALDSTQLMPLYYAPAHAA